MERIFLLIVFMWNTKDGASAIQGEHKRRFVFLPSPNGEVI